MQILNFEILIKDFDMEFDIDTSNAWLTIRGLSNLEFVHSVLNDTLIFLSVLACYNVILIGYCTVVDTSSEVSMIIAHVLPVSLFAYFAYGCILAWRKSKYLVSLLRNVSKC